ncbi:MAG: glycerophosphodiester phosphodiesterase [Candidatus Melainabacteria bacterium]|nr:glycerophosphodiester phosphodiesterase [Candidatus Melainabacteria bacterium]
MVLKLIKPGTLIPGSRPFVIAHRGAARQAPENTIAAFDLAHLSGMVDAIELDVQLSKDGHLVVMHDKTVERTTNGAGLLSSLTLPELKRLDAGYHFSCDGGNSYPYRQQGVVIPTLDEVLARFPDQVFLVELKDSSRSAALKLAESIARHNAYDRVLVVVINVRHSAAVTLRRLDSRIKTGHTSREIALFVGLSKARLGRLFASRGLTFEVPMRKFQLKLPTPAFVRQAHKQGVCVLVWTINDPDVMRKCLDLEVDGIITDDPATLKQVLFDRRKR